MQLAADASSHLQSQRLSYAGGHTIDILHQPDPLGRSTATAVTIAGATARYHLDPAGRICAVAEVVDAVTDTRVRSVEWCFEVL